MPRGNSDYWTQERFDELKRLYTQGLSSGAIAARMGCSRNTICGKIHRTGLQRNGTFIDPKTRPKKPRLTKAKRLQLMQPSNLPPELYKRPPKPKYEPPRKPVPLPEVVPFAPAKKKGNPTITTVGASQCRFPLWGMSDTRTDEKPLCGLPVRSGSAYCEEHHQRCYSGRWFRGERPRHENRKGAFNFQSKRSSLAAD